MSYVIENNGNPGTQICNITGHNYFEDLLDLVEDKTGFSKNESEGNNDKQGANIQIDKDLEIGSKKKVGMVTQYAIKMTPNEVTRIHYIT